MNSEATIAPWRIVWEGGRLADIFHLEGETALDAVDVTDCDDLRAELQEWIDDHGAEFTAELRYLFQ